MSEDPWCDQELAAVLTHASALLTGASDASMKISYYDTLKEFFGDSNCWQEGITFTVVANTQDYQVEPVSGQIIRLLSVIDQNNVPQSAGMPFPGLVRFANPYSTTQPMLAIVVKNVIGPFKDGRPAPPHIPEWVLPKYGLGILDGLVGRMMLEPGTSYFNQMGGAFRMNRFRTAVITARVDAMHMNVVGAQAWTYPQQFRTFNQRGGVSTFNINPSPPQALR